MQKHAFVEKNAQFRFAALFVFALALLGVLFAFPQQAQAKSYTMPQTTIDATIQENGDLHVVEQRQFNFNGSYTAVWWELGNDLPTGASVQVNGVGMADLDSEGNANASLNTLSSTPFQAKWRSSGGPGNTSYSFDEPQNTVYVFFNKADQNIVVQLDYTVKLAAQSYSDVGELYWQFVGSNWAEDSENVTMTLHLPVAAGQTVTAGENVRAWGHGPLDATVAINAEEGTVTYKVPRTTAGNYAEARVVFPTAWLTVGAKAANKHESTARLDSVLSEEQTWADQANAKRATQTGGLVVVVLLCIALLAWGIRSFIRYGKELKPNFTDTYWRDVPIEGEHPAVVGRVWRFGKEEPSDFSATIMHLANAGALLINKGEYDKKGLLGTKKVSDYYITRVPQVELSLNSEIDRKAMSFLFDVIGEGQQSIWLGNIKAFGEADPQRFNSEMMAWQGLVTAHTNAGEYIEGYSNSKTVSMTVVAAALFCLSIFIAAIVGNLLVIIPCVITAIALFVVSRFMSRRTQKGADAFARCGALKKWLTEFSALNERPTTDVKVWGEFMVYAFIFGVAKEAIAELQKAVPEMFNVDQQLASNPTYVPWWVWYHPYGYGQGLDMPDFSSMLEASLVDSMQAVQSALSGGSSSGGGFGGGFSGGGGGGFGGGGGAR